MFSPFKFLMTKFDLAVSSRSTQGHHSYLVDLETLISWFEEDFYMFLRYMLGHVTCDLDRLCKLSFPLPHDTGELKTYILYRGLYNKHLCIVKPTIAEIFEKKFETIL